MSVYKDFICKSEIYNPRTITYRDWIIESNGEGGNRCINVWKGRLRMVHMWIDTHTSDACFIHSVGTMIAGVYFWLEDTCTGKDLYSWDYRTWEDVDKFMQELVDYVRNN